MSKKPESYNSKHSILEDINEELAEEARIPRYKLLSPKDSKRLNLLRQQLALGGLLIPMFFAFLVQIVLYLDTELARTVSRVFFFFGGLAIMVSGAIQTFSKPDWNPSMLMSYRQKVRRDDISGILLMIGGLLLIGIMLAFIAGVSYR